MGKIQFVYQHDQSDCGPACLSMITRYYGKKFTLQSLREKCSLNHEGVSMLGISQAAESLGLKTYGVKITFEQLRSENPFPCIAYWKKEHFVVIYKIKGKKIYIADPGYGLLKYTEQDFLEHWIGTSEDGQEYGFCLLIESTDAFKALKDEKIKISRINYFLSLFKKYFKHLVYLFITLLFGSLIHLVLPVLTRVIFDIGITQKDLNLIYVLLAAQLVLFLSKSSADFIRSWILLFISTRINMTLISEFLSKLMKLSIAFFDTKLIGDLLQRIDDHHRIEEFLSVSMLNVLFSIINFFVFGVVLIIFSWKIFYIYLVGTVLYILWIFLFVKKRSYIDYQQFTYQAKSQSKIIEIISGIEEIKLNNCEKKKRLDWEKNQVKLFRVNIESLKLHQYQEIGSLIINELKNILISFLTAYLVVKGDITIGIMLSVQYIIGQLNGPMELLLYFINSAQDGKISFNRLIDIQQNKDDINPDFSDDLPRGSNDIIIKDLSFTYQGPLPIPVLKKINLHIPAGKITAIVGTSGSGKTTLVKLLLGFYEPVSGNINIGTKNLGRINRILWRQRCGAVMQQGFIFSDTIAGNITLCDDVVDEERLDRAIALARVDDFTAALPLGKHTKIGPEGKELSQGQKQRVLIARAIYSNPDYLFFDEATNALDANNEKAVVEGLKDFYGKRTVIIVAHRLSTVKSADQIVVLNQGEIEEVGTHENLIAQKGYYYRLIRNQLELEE